MNNVKTLSSNNCTCSKGNSWVSSHDRQFFYHVTSNHVAATRTCRGFSKRGMHVLGALPNYINGTMKCSIPVNWRREHMAVPFFLSKPTRLRRWSESLCRACLSLTWVLVFGYGGDWTIRHILSESSPGRLGKSVLLLWSLECLHKWLGDSQKMWVRL
jgi:hypothetical protein